MTKLISVMVDDSIVDRAANMLHKPTGEVHTGVILDYIGVDVIVQMSDSAEMFIEDDELIIDTRYDPWELIEVL